MHDIRWIRENPEAFNAAMAKRNVAAQSPAIAEYILKLDKERRERITQEQELQQERNQIAKQIGMAKRNGDDAEALVERANALKAEIEALNADLENDQELQGMLESLPNIPDGEVPEGTDEDDNVELRKWSEPTIFDFTPKEHNDLGEALGLLDFKQAANVSGARFVYLRDDIARMERALANFMLELHTGAHGFHEVVPPYLVRDNALYGSGQLPKFSEDCFRTTTDHWLIPTAEVPLVNYAAGKIIDTEELPLRMTAYSPCFRSEAGSAGRDTTGMIRQHQFTKVELVSITSAEESAQEHEHMLFCAEQVLQKLELPYRVMLLSCGDMGFSAQKTYDLEVWLPGQDTYREISSVSNCGAFQARRMNARYRAKGEKQTHFVHALNGSALAVGRTIIAVMENYQQADGSIAIPDVLQPYMRGQKVIEKAGKARHAA